MKQRISILLSILSLAISLIAARLAYDSKTLTATKEMVPSQPSKIAVPEPPQTQTQNIVDALNERLVSVSARVKPAVVTVFIERVWKERVVNPFFGFDGFFDDFFFGGGRRMEPEERVYRSQGLGSGVIISKDGFILTNNHVVADANTIQVNLFDKRIRKAKVIGKDPNTDLAVIKIDEDNLPFIEQGDSSNLHVGEIVLAVGSPMSPGLAHTVTQGIVSAVGRSNVGVAEYEDFIQTDAAINPGNSGGALVNLKGQLVGINSAIVSQSGGSQGIGFAVTINMAKTVMESLIKFGKVTRAWIGISTQDVTEELAEGLQLKSTAGVIVSNLDPNGPSAAAGLQRGDVVLELNGEKIENSTQFRNRVAEARVGDKLALKIQRGTESLSKQIQLTELSQQNEAQETRQPRRRR